MFHCANRPQFIHLFHIEKYLISGFIIVNIAIKIIFYISWLSLMQDFLWRIFLELVLLGHGLCEHSTSGGGIKLFSALYFHPQYIKDQVDAHCFQHLIFLDLPFLLTEWMYIHVL